MWVARDNHLGNFNLHLFNRKPIRGERSWVFDDDGTIFGCDYMEIDSTLFPELKWEDEPIEIFLISGEDYQLLQKKKEADRREYLENLTPIEREIINGKDKLSLFKCINRVKRYTFSNQRVQTKFLTIDDFLEHNFYTDDGDYEAYLSDGDYFIGVNLKRFCTSECEEFIKENKHLLSENKELCIYFVDYPEDK